MNKEYLKFKIKDNLRKILKSAPVIKCLSFVIYLYAVFVAKTTKWNISGIDELAKFTKENNAVIIGWHSRTTMMPFFWSKYVKSRLTALVSPHQDGQIIAKFLRWFNIKSVNASTNERAKQGALELMRELVNGSSLFISPDGPRGPRMRLKKSPIYFAQKSQKPIYCVCFSASKALVFEKAWDKTMIMLPFGKGVLNVSEPIFVPENLTPEELEMYRKKVEDIAINQLVECDKKVGRVPCNPAGIDEYKRKENE